MRLPTALARRRANATPMSHGLSVFLLIDAGSAVTGCPHDWCPNIILLETKQLRFQAAGENHMEHYDEKGATHDCWTREQRVHCPSVQCPIPDCVCLLFDSGRLQTGSERFDGTAVTPGKRNTGSGLDWWYSVVGVVRSSTICSRCKHVDLSCWSRKLFWVVFGNCV